MSENPKNKIKNKDVINCSTCFKLLGIPSRMVIYTYLADGKKATVNEIVSKLDLTQPTVSYHLKEMKTAGVLDSKRSGKKIHYFIDTSCPHNQEGCILHKVILTKQKD